MRNIMTNMRFMLLWIPGTIVALFATAIVGLIVLMGGGIAVAFVWGKEVELAPPVISLLVILLIFSVVGFFLGLIFGSIQKSLLRSRTRDPWRGWTIASIIGGIIGVDVTILLIGGQMAQSFLFLTLPPTETLFWLGFQVSVIPLGCLALAQMVVLWQHVRGAWTWVLANITAGIVLFSLIAFGAVSWAVTPFMSILAVAAIMAAPGIVTGFAMLWLINLNWRRDFPEY